MLVRAWMEQHSATVGNASFVRAVALRDHLNAAVLSDAASDELREGPEALIAEAAPAMVPLPVQPWQADARMDERVAGELTDPQANSFFDDPEIDALIDRIEAGGLNSYVLESAHFAFMSFELRRPPVTLDALAAAATLAQRFEADANFRERMKIEALQIGALFRAV